MGWLDSPIESFKAAYNGAIAKWQDALASLDSAYAEFQANRDYALSDDELGPRWSELDGKISFLQSTIQGVSNAKDAIVNFISSFGEPGVDNTILDSRDYLAQSGLSGRKNMGGMGFLPAIPWSFVALITAGVAAVWTIVNQLRSFNVDVLNRKIAEQNILNSQTGKPLIPFIDLGPPEGGGVLSGLSDTTKWAVIGLLGMLAFKAFNEHKRLP